MRQYLNLLLSFLLRKLLTKSAAWISLVILGNSILASSSGAASSRITSKESSAQNTTNLCSRPATFREMGTVLVQIMLWMSSVSFRPNIEIFSSRRRLRSLTKLSSLFRLIFALVLLKIKQKIIPDIESDQRDLSDLPRLF